MDNAHDLELDWNLESIKSWIFIGLKYRAYYFIFSSIIKRYESTVTYKWSWRISSKIKSPPRWKKHPAKNPPSKTSTPNLHAKPPRQTYTPNLHAEPNIPAKNPPSKTSTLK